MKELINLLNQKERKILGLLCLMLFAALLLYLLFALMEGGRFAHSQEALSVKNKEYQKINASKTDKEREWLRWEETHLDLADLKEKYFYSESLGITQLRRDLQRIFDEVGVRAPSLNYEYSDFEEAKIKKVKVSFNITASYFSLKRFIDTIEKFPRFLIIEKVDFLDTDNQSGGFRLSFALAGYYDT